MAVLLETTIQRFVGLSIDVKPTGVPVGSTFYEYDSKHDYVCYDGTNWSIVPRELAARFNVMKSEGGVAEEDQLLGFTIALSDCCNGDIAVADIDITGITQTMHKGTGGNAFSSAGITQPTFNKIDGMIYLYYKFLAAEWALGDTYLLKAIDITCEIDGQTLYVPQACWSNIVLNEN